MKYFFQRNNYLIISIGAIPAAIFRFQIKEVFLANIIGCFLIGLINASNLPKRYKLFLGFGFCGTLTSFSGWSFQLYKFINDGLYIDFFLHAILVVLIRFISVSLGYLFAKKIIN